MQNMPVWIVPVVTLTRRIEYSLRRSIIEKLQKREVKSIDRRLGSVMDAGYHLDKTNNFFAATSWGVMQVAKLSCLAFTGVMAYKGEFYELKKLQD